MDRSCSEQDKSSGVADEALGGQGEMDRASSVLGATQRRLPVFRLTVYSSSTLTHTLSYSLFHTHILSHSFRDKDFSYSFFDSLSHSHTFTLTHSQSLVLVVMM